MPKRAMSLRKGSVLKTHPQRFYNTRENELAMLLMKALAPLRVRGNPSLKLSVPSVDAEAIVIFKVLEVCESRIRIKVFFRVKGGSIAMPWRTTMLIAEGELTISPEQ